MLDSYSITDTGENRTVNQDFIFASNKPVGILPNLYIVADGMGGHNAGDFASKCAVEVLINELQNLNFYDNEDVTVLDVVSSAIQKANEIVYKISLVKEGTAGMGTTLVVATCDGDKLQVFNVGDSRLYVMKDEIQQITEDHSYIEEMIRLYGMDRSQMEMNKDKNKITRAIGVEMEVEIDYFEVEIEKGMYVLMCTDGLTNMIDDEIIEQKLSTRHTIMQKVIDLVETANYNGGLDNISVILVRI